MEVLLSVAVFSLFAVALIGAYLYGQESTALAGKSARATLVTDEGMEAVRNIRDAGFANLVDGTFGLTTTGNQWNVSGASDTVGEFTRSVAVTTIDAFRKRITTTVNWQQNAQRNGVSSAVSYLTNWQRLGVTAGGVLMYARNAVSSFFRVYDSGADTLGAATAIAGSGVGMNLVVRTSPNKTEAVAGYVTSAGVLNVLCFDGATWSPEWSVTVGGTGTTRRFDIAYETNSADAIVLYSTNAAPTNELAYRTKAGTSACGSANWSSESSLNPTQSTGVVQWVKLAGDRRLSQNTIAAIWADANADLSAMMWSGSVWGNEPSLMESSLERVTTVQDVEDFDVEFESNSGDVMVVWANSAGANGTNGVHYRTCTGGGPGCTWGAVSTPPTLADDATNLDISANPNSNEMVFASIGNAGNDLQIGYWSGSAWTDTANADTSCNVPAAGTGMVSTGWLVSGSTASAVVVYGDQGSSALDWYTGVVVAGLPVFTKQTDVVLSPAPTSTKNTIDIQMDPLNTDQLMLVIADNANDLFAKHAKMNSSGTVSWTNSDGAALETALPNSLASPFSFSFWRK